MKKNILVLDDSRFMLQLISDLLKSSNHDVATFDSGHAALLNLISNQYDLVITDLNMPTMDGIEFAKQVRNAPGCRFLPIIMVSSELDDARISKAKKMGISTFLSKPIKEDQLKSILEIILNKRMTPRIPIRMKVFYKQSDAGAEYSTSYTLNVSLGGMFLEAENPLPPGHKLDLELYLKESHAPITCQARVAWTIPSRSQNPSAPPPGMGLAFIKLQEHQLQEFIKSGKWKYST